MAFWSLDERTQLALILAGLATGGVVGVSGCGDRTVMDPVPPDARLDARDSLVADMVPPDARPDRRRDIWGADPLPADARPDMRRDSLIADMVPRDSRVKADRPPISDPLPPDASIPNPSQSPRPNAFPGRQLPLSRDFRAHIKVLRTGNILELTAETHGPTSREQSYRWMVTAGTLDRREGTSVRWTPPSTPGRHMVQLTARDGRGSIAVDVLLLDL